MEIINGIVELMENDNIGGIIVSTTTASMITLAIAALVSRNKRLKNLVTKEDFNKGIKEAKLYTDEKLNEHEEKQIIEIDNMKCQIKETHSMVKFLYEVAIKK